MIFIRAYIIPKGSKFGACDMAGNLALWKFNAPEDALRPFHVCLLMIAREIKDMK